MANYANTKSIIAQNIYTNHEGKVTAEMVKTAANEIVNTLIAGGYLYAGVAKLTPTQTNPGSPDANVFYIATEPGTYTNFVGAGGALAVADGEVAIFKWNGSWSKEVTGAATAAQVTELGQEVDNIDQPIKGDNGADDLSFTDEQGYAIVIFKNGGIVTKDFDSSQDATSQRRGLMSAADKQKLDEQEMFVDDESVDLALSDENNNSIGIFKNGDFRTKNFDSSRLRIVDGGGDLSFADENGNVIVDFKNGGIKTKNFDSSNIQDNNIPSYYEDYLKSKIDEINNNEFANGLRADSFIFSTDTHIKNNAMHSAAISAEILKHSGCFKVIWGGDAIWAYADAGLTVDECKEEIIKQWRVQRDDLLKIVPFGKLYKARGNHEFTIRIDGTDPAIRLNAGYTFAQSVSFNNIVPRELSEPKVKFNESDDGCYYFFDEPQAHLRYVVLDGQSKDFSDYVGPYAWGNDFGIGISDTQLSWIKTNAFLTLPDGYSLIVIIHEGITSVTYPNGYEQYANIKTEIDALANKTGDYANLNVGRVIVFCGHEHKDDQVFENNVLHIETANDYVGGDVNRSMYYDAVTRQKGTITEQLFDFNTIDIENNKVRCLRIGAGYNRLFNLQRIDLQVNETYDISSLLEIVPVAYNSYNSLGNTYNNGWTILNNIVSVDNNGIITALSTGEAVVFAKDADNNKEFFYIKVS